MGEIERRDGRPFLRVRSTSPVNEPFLDLLVELQWNTGRLVREYTVLLDPPGYGGKAAELPPPPVAAPTVRPAPAGDAVRKVAGLMKDIRTTMLTKPPMLWVTLHGLFLTALLIWHRAPRFGPLRQLPEQRAETPGTLPSPRGPAARSRGRR